MSTKTVTTPRVRWVTAQWLRDAEACYRAQEAFADLFGKHAKVRPIDCVRACWRNGHQSWADWLLDALLPPNLERSRNKAFSDRSWISSRSSDYRYARMISGEKKK